MGSPFLSSGICSETNEVVESTQCKNLQLIPCLELGCSLRLADWNRIGNVLPYVQEFYFMNPMDFNNGSDRDQLTYIYIEMWPN